MTAGQAFSYLALWSAVGCAIFSVYVVVVFRTGIVYTARTQDGMLKKRMSLGGLLSMLTLLLGIVGFQVLANDVSLARQSLTLRFPELLFLNFGHYMILLLFDSLVIDGLVLSLWRPAFLRIPDSMGWQSMKKHLMLSIPIGPAAGIGISALSTAISSFLWGC